MRLSFQVLSNHPTIDFAAGELKRYHSLMNGNDHTDEQLPSVLRLGLIADLVPGRPIPANPFDDEIIIDIVNGQGIVAGANPRSCLLAAYRLLQEAGCRFLRPGPAGELIPRNSWDDLIVQIDETPSYRHRGICIEGYISREVFLGILDWIPKNGMNAYFIQFREGITFFERWYEHQENPFLSSEAKNIAEIREIIDDGIAAIKLRSLIYHAAGHGWTCEPLGMPGLNWDAIPEVPANVSCFFAELNGERKLFGGIPLNTNLCYGDPRVRDLVVNSIADYAAEHREIDLIHFWLADGNNNHCECHLCRASRPADLYVAMLNQLDEILTARELVNRIVFLIYTDLLWAPEWNRIHNPDRFVLMFAPITRSYSHPFTSSDEQPVLPFYKRNQLTFPRSASENLAYLKSWQALPGYENVDSFDFDYHLMWDHYKDPGCGSLSAVLHADLKNMRKMGLNGLISCQVQRSFFPSPLLMAVMARTLWNRQTDLEVLVNDVYCSSFGCDGLLVRHYLEKISILFHAAWMRLEEPLINPEQVQRLTLITPLVIEFAPIIDRNLVTHDACYRQSWLLLALFGEYIRLFAEFCQAVAEGDADKAGSQLAMLKNWIFIHELQLVYVFDCEIYVSVIDGLFQQLVTDKARLPRYAHG